MPTHLLSLDALLAVLNSLENGHMTGHMTEQDLSSAGHKTPQTELSNSAGIIFTTSGASGGEEVTSSLLPLTSSELAGQKLVLSKSLSGTSGFRHSDSLPAMTLTEMRKISKSEEVVGDVATGRGKAASGRQVGVAMCQKEGAGSEDDVGMEIALPSSKELLQVRQRKKVQTNKSNNFVLYQGAARGEILRHNGWAWFGLSNTFTECFQSGY